MKNAAIVSGLFAGMLAFGPAVAANPPDCPRMEKHHEKMMTDLKLNADQKTKLQEFRKQHREEMKPFHETMKSIRDKVKAELLKPQPSKQVLDGLAADLGEQHKKMALMRNDHLLQVKAVLTPEQFSKLVSRDWMAGPGIKGCPHKGDCPHKGNKKRGCRHGGGAGGPGDEM